ncbi:MAG: hypothetical protein ACQEQF_03245 [Bacillota bacterium]
MFFPIFSMNKKELLFFIAIFIISFMLGAIISNLYLSKKLDYYILENKILMDRLQNLHNTINKLNKTINEGKNNPVKEIKFEIDSKLNNHKKQELKKILFAVIENIIGTEISEININLLIKSIDARYFIIDDEEYKIKIKYIILSEKTKIFVKVE